MRGINKRVRIKQAGQDVFQGITRPGGILMQKRLRRQMAQHHRAQQKQQRQMNHIRRLDAGDAPDIILPQANPVPITQALPGERQ